MLDADHVLIADTGSTDDTVDIARRCGAIVSQICITPWRFDSAATLLSHWFRPISTSASRSIWMK
jgi:glycosyltransferase involved in cell wall biosynthesis